MFVKSRKGSRGMESSNPIVHIIRPGDTLYNLAILYGTTVQDIINTNLALDPYNLRVGQQIYIYPHNNYDYWISINQVNLMKNMNLAWLEHVFWTRLFLISVADNLGDLEATKARLLENPKDIADVFRKYYGNNFANNIQKLLTEHLVIGGDLIVALKNQNDKLAQELNTKWYKNADDMAMAFSSINPFYPINKVKNMLYDHLRLTSDEVSNRLKKDYIADIKSYDLVQKEVLQMAMFFTDGIVRQFGNLF